MDEEESCVEHLRLCLIAILTNLNDDTDSHAWQQAQLFRQSIDHLSSSDQAHRLQINVTIIDQQSFYV
jgi:secreted protein with Ig-like and vWFA domain